MKKFEEYIEQEKEAKPRPRYGSTKMLDIIGVINNLEHKFRMEVSKEINKLNIKSIREKNEVLKTIVEKVTQKLIKNPGKYIK